MFPARREGERRERKGGARQAAAYVTRTKVCTQRFIADAVSHVGSPVSFRGERRSARDGYYREERHKEGRMFTMVTTSTHGLLNGTKPTTLRLSKGAHTALHNPVRIFLFGGKSSYERTRPPPPREVVLCIMSLSHASRLTPPSKILEKKSGPHSRMFELSHTPKTSFRRRRDAVCLTHRSTTPWPRMGHVPHRDRVGCTLRSASAPQSLHAYSDLVSSGDEAKSPRGQRNFLVICNFGDGKDLVRRVCMPSARKLTMRCSPAYSMSPSMSSRRFWASLWLLSRGF